MAKPAKTFVQVHELGDNKILLVAVLNKKQAAEIHRMFEPRSRQWRGTYQSLAKAMVEALSKWAKKP